MIRIVGLAAVALVILACSGGPAASVASAAGRGGGGGRDAGEGVDAAGDPDACPAKFCDDAGNPICFVNSDCPESLDIECHSVHCDPTGHTTAPGSPMLGCYYLNDEVGTPCMIGDVDGVCAEGHDSIICEGAS